MTIVVTGATGHLGRLVVESLIERGVAPQDIRALGRTEERLSALASLGVQTAVIDFEQPETLDPAFAGADALLLVSGSEVGKRMQQHANAIDAAVRAGVGRVVYTSAPHADDTALVLAPEHAATEKLLADSGLTTTVLRNNWYTENYVAQLDTAAQTGTLVSSTADGRVASATRADYADPAAVVLMSPGHEGAIYELAGDVAWTFTDLAAALGAIVGREVEYRAVSADERRAILIDAGLDAGTADFVVALDGNIRDGALADAPATQSPLIGRPTTSLEDGLRASQAAVSA
ncbi:SDR family oxidoreductase [Kitasatospora herbaricolor]|uniref:SDR family oxidoreductase n=1 Tax=Kitasatospora herbaricolor TaxID=68217 RepID=UPI0036DC5B89